MLKTKTIIAGDAAEDGHPCEVALAFRLAVVRSGIVDEIPADVLDLAIQFAWIGKAVSRTTALSEWFMSGIDPNTREIVTAMAMDSLARQTALTHACKAAAAPGLASSLKSVRSTQAFGHAMRVVQSVCGSHPSVSDVERMATLSFLSSKLPDTKRLAAAKTAEGVVNLAAFRKQREISS